MTVVEALGQILKMPAGDAELVLCHWAAAKQAQFKQNRRLFLPGLGAINYTKYSAKEISFAPTVAATTLLN